MPSKRNYFITHLTVGHRKRIVARECRAALPTVTRLSATSKQQTIKIIKENSSFPLMIFSAVLNIRKIMPVVLLSSLLFYQADFQTAFPQSLSQDEQININVYENTYPAIVVIDADVSDGVSSGTGCIIDSRGIILTSSHVIDGSDKIEVTTYNGKKYNAKLIKIMGERSDLALLKINIDTPLNVVKLGDSTKIKVGQKVLAIGNPFGFDRTLTTGIVSRIDYNRNKIQTDAAINPGCSGGPLLNSNGEVIGINQSIYNPDNNKSNIGIGFAVPVNAAKRFIAKSQSDIDSLLTVGNEKTINKNSR